MAAQVNETRQNETRGRWRAALPMRCKAYAVPRVFRHPQLGRAARHGIARDDGLDVMAVRVEHAPFAAPSAAIDEAAGKPRGRCEVRAAVQVLQPNTPPNTELKAKRVRDNRKQ